MKIFFQDPRVLIGLIIAHILLFFSFHDKVIFWYIFAGSILILIAYAMFQEEVDDNVSFIQYIFLGALTGLLLYSIFWLGIRGMKLLHLPYDTSLRNLYKWFAPTIFWQYIALVLVAAPGEELFWRGFIQKRLSKMFKPGFSILAASILYASVHIYAGSFLLVLAAFISGFAWGYLYLWKKSMPLVIVSHIIFDLMMFIFLPLH
ncbi:CPBP family intramembrane metalloprotease [Neobacillus sp. MER 74]|uniref:CPBP family intramembrane glutamic endopeptidase n=1 Tax=Neobacillus sp. MER 74 TaxID=2939566 RepID=UPI00203E6A1F|nr:type II CAAX endopeptidase family protein [Neobacillus sp. MER 74]MCM3114133.1 CPBP family intramembrane metalloprotease [Neobacillus sp. MER 74]